MTHAPVVHACSRTALGKCAGASKGKAQSLFVLEDGTRVCFAHLTVDERGWRTNCTHSLGTSGKPCTYCGGPVP